MTGGVLKLGWRNIWRNRRRTFISMSAVGIGLILVLFYSGLLAGVLGDAKNQLDNGGMGHVEVYAKGFRPRRAVAQSLPHPDAWLKQVALPPGTEVGSRLLARGLASSAHGSEAVEVQGVDFAAEPALSAHLRDVRQGALPADDDARGVLVGERLAERLRLKVGSKMRVMVQRADGEMSANLFRVRGIFHSMAASISKRQVYVTQDAARTLLGLDARVHQVVIQLPDARQAEGVKAQVAAAAGDGAEVVTWGELLPILKRMEDLTNSIVMAIAVFVYLLVGLGILNTMLMSVLERTREFGVLMSVGTRPRRVVGLVLAESFWIATISVALGLALGGTLTWYYSTHPITLFAQVGESMEIGGAAMSTAFKTKFLWTNVAQVSVYVYVMALVVGLYPAWRVSKLQPAEALRRA